MASKRYTFPDNKLPYGWTATRVSQGGQLDGVWNRDIKNNKIYWTGVGGGTETGWWGEKLSIPVSATGDIIVEATIRQKSTTSLNASFGVGFNHVLSAHPILYGCMLTLPGTAFNTKSGFNAGVLTAFPGFPSKNSQNSTVTDQLSNIRIVRKWSGATGYVSLYMDGLYVGAFTNAVTITSVNILSAWYQAGFGCEKWLQDLSIYPSSVVL